MQIIFKIKLILFLSFFFSFVKAEPETLRQTLRLAITTTTQDSGLMTKLNPVFEKEYNVKVNVITVGSGQALRLAEQGDVDIVLTHAPEDEKRFIQSGFGLERHQVMHNDFIIIGPATDPAKIKDTQSINEAFNNLFTNKFKFISRADESGTHKKEQAIWKQTSLVPEGAWYIKAGSGMGSVLLLANEEQAYTLTDRGTYLAFKERLNLTIQFQGDDFLYNPYHVIAVNPEKHGHINSSLAEKYIAFLTGEKGQTIINDFKLHGQQLFNAVNNFEKNEIAEASSVNENKSFFLNAVISSFNLIFNFDQQLFYVVWTSLKVSLIAVLIAVLFSLPLGVVVALNNFKGKNFLLACLNTLMALPTVVVGLLLYGILNRQGLLGDLGLLYTPTAMVIGQCALIIPIIWNLCISAVNSADPRLAKTCAALGASYFQRSIIYMSEVRFALIAAIVTGFGRAIGEVGIAMMLGGNIDGYTRTMTTAIALETSKGEFEFALALGFMLLLVAFVVNAVLQQFQLKAK
ncbi:MAG: ABC transporter permease [Gammaproteobacteria bacterium]|jgi:tungstate transport system substrate-binding protein